MAEPSFIYLIYEILINSKHIKNIALKNPKCPMCHDTCEPDVPRNEWPQNSIHAVFEKSKYK